MLNRRKMLSSLSSIPFIGWIFCGGNSVEAKETNHLTIKVMDEDGIMSEIALSQNTTIVSYTKEEVIEYKIRNGKLFRKITTPISNEFKIISQPDRSNKNSSFYQGQR